jgi:3-oxoacyl-[acyl-carrier protein] reductase
MTHELKDLTAIVTGGSRGIGLAIAHALATGGARVAVLGRDAERARVAAADLPGEGHLGLGCDVASSDDVRRSVQEIEAAFGGGVAILVNNAGITRDNLLLRLQDEDWDDVIDTNLRGAFNMIRACTKGMMKRRGGSIINISSVVGLMGNPGQTNYAASKAGLHGLTKSVARELASRGVRCNAVAPGYITTDMTGALTDEQTAKLQASIPLGRLGAPEDIAGLVRFLAGPAGSYITGQIITVDGGMVM